MSRTDPQFNLRIPQELRDRVMAAAQANKRSATAEILARLEETFAIEAALDEIMPGAPLTGTAGMLLDMDAQLGRRAKDYRDSAMTAHSEEIERHIESTNCHLYTVEHQLEQIIGLLTKK